MTTGHFIPSLTFLRNADLFITEMHLGSNICTKALLGTTGTHQSLGITWAGRATRRCV